MLLKLYIIIKSICCSTICLPVCFCLTPDTIRNSRVSLYKEPTRVFRMTQDTWYDHKNIQLISIQKLSSWNTFYWILDTWETNLKRPKPNHKDLYRHGVHDRKMSTNIELLTYRIIYTKGTLLRSLNGLFTMQPKWERNVMKMVMSCGKYFNNVVNGYLSEKCIITCDNNHAYGTDAWLMLVFQNMNNVL